jgi:hypothetical protein
MGEGSPDPRAHADAQIVRLGSKADTRLMSALGGKQPHQNRSSGSYIQIKPTDGSGFTSVGEDSRDEPVAKPQLAVNRQPLSTHERSRLTVVPRVNPTAADNQVRFIGTVDPVSRQRFTPA